jgi:DNA-binding SARP family transcriptional activator
MGESATLHLLGGPHVVLGSRRLPIPEGSKRLLAYVALHGGRIERRRAAAVLWPDVDPHRAAGNLRSATWRLRCSGLPILEVRGEALYLVPGLRVDLEDVCDWARRVTALRPRPGDLDVRPAAMQGLDLLPGWYDDWVLQQREELRRLLLHAIDALAGLLVAARRYGDAVEAALTAVCAEPLRESAQRALIEAHLAEGNRCEAYRTYHRYQSLLADELGERPSPALRSLVGFGPLAPVG